MRWQPESTAHTSTTQMPQPYSLYSTSAITWRCGDLYRLNLPVTIGRGQFQLQRAARCMRPGATVGSVNQTNSRKLTLTA